LDVHYVRIREGQNREARMVTIEHDGTVRPLSDLISESEIIINGTYQDTDNPINFVTEEEKDILKPGSLIIDVSCDEGMGFYFAKPTTFKKPILNINNIDYYAVDHTPSYLWESASRSISAALIGYLPTILEGRKSWMKNPTIQKAINIKDGVIKKESVLTFQHRKPDYPHDFIKS
jgi:alanine dehydrogenase